MKTGELETALAKVDPERTVCVAFRHNGETVLSEIESASINGESIQLNEARFAKSALHSGISDMKPDDLVPMSEFQKELLIEGAYRVLDDRRKKIEIFRKGPVAVVSKEIQQGIENAERDLVVAGWLIERLKKPVDS